jgi:hypothetical protein
VHQARSRDYRGGARPFRSVLVVLLGIDTSSRDAERFQDSKSHGALRGYVVLAHGPQLPAAVISTRIRLPISKEYSMRSRSSVRSISSLNYRMSVG